MNIQAMNCCFMSFSKKKQMLRKEHLLIQHLSLKT